MAAKMESLLPKELVKKARMQQVKYDGHKVTIIYSLSFDENGDDIFTQECHDAPRESFKAALMALKPHVATLVCMTPAEIKKQTDTMEIRGVNFKELANKPMAQVIVVRKLQCGRCLNFNTPFMLTYAEEPSEIVLPNEFVDALDEVKDQAKKYIGGDRLQQRLPFPEPDADADSAAAESEAAAEDTKARSRRTAAGE
jgi:hypothetical protein